MKALFQAINKVSLIVQIIIGLIIGAIIGTVLPSLAPAVGILGSLFVGALKAVAPFLVFILVVHAVAQHTEGAKTNIRPILLLYLIGTFSAALVGVLASFIFPSTITLISPENADLNAPTGIAQVMKNLLMNL